MDERKWIERILAGDTQSFSCLVAKYEKMAYTIALRILENREEAEEAVQDAFVLFPIFISIVSSQHGFIGLCIVRR